MFIISYLGRYKIRINIPVAVLPGASVVATDRYQKPLFTNHMKSEEATEREIWNAAWGIKVSRKLLSRMYENI